MNRTDSVDRPEVPPGRFATDYRDAQFTSAGAGPPPASRQLAWIAAAYRAALLAGDRLVACWLAEQALADGVSLDEVYQTVLQPALEEVGRCWEVGVLTVADEHLATAITRVVLEQCAAIARPLAAGPPQIIATCVGPERHDLGLRMVADCLELSGWPTLYLGGTMPVADIVTLAQRHQIGVVAISATLGRYTPAVQELIRALRQTTLGTTVKVLVGGQPFQRIPELWRAVGADGTASDALGAVAWVQTHVQKREDP